jgi:hypothetical protein
MSIVFKGIEYDKETFEEIIKIGPINTIDYSDTLMADYKKERFREYDEWYNRVTKDISKLGGWYNENKDKKIK